MSVELPPGGCTFLAVSKELTIVSCSNSEERWIASMAHDYELEWAEHERQLDLQRIDELYPPMEEADIDYVDVVLAEDLRLVA